MSKDDRIQQAVLQIISRLDEDDIAVAHKHGRRALSSFCRWAVREQAGKFNELEQRLLGGDAPHSWQGVEIRNALRTGVWDHLVRAYGLPPVQILPPTPQDLCIEAPPDDCPATMPRGAQYVLTVIVENYESWSDFYYVSTTRSRRHWVLWHTYHDDGDSYCGAEAACLKKGISRKHAALFMVRDDWAPRAKEGWKPTYIEAPSWEYTEMWGELRAELCED